MHLNRLTEIFKVDENIRYIGVVDKKDAVLFSKRREGIASVNPEHTNNETFVVTVRPTLNRAEHASEGLNH